MIFLHKYFMVVNSSHNLLILQIHVTIFLLLLHNLLKEKQNSIKDFLPPNNFESFTIAPPAGKGISKIISSHKNCKSTDQKKISAKVIRLLHNKVS